MQKESARCSIPDPSAVQSAYQITWMLLILFGAPEVLDRYNIRSTCEAFNAGRWFDSGEPPFCDHKDVTALPSASQVPISDICRAMFPLGDDNCPDLRGPGLEDAQAWVLPSGVTCTESADVNCELLLKDAGSVRAQVGAPRRGCTPAALAWLPGHMPSGPE